MVKVIAGFLTIFWGLASFGPVLAGDWTAHGFLYKPSLGARGTAENGRYDSGQDRVDERLNKEIWVGDPNYGTTIQDALTAISSNQAILRVPAGTHSISGNLIVPSNVTLRVERRATLAIPQGVTLTINGGLEAGLYQVFSCTGTGKVVFGRPGGVKELVPQWWGAKGDGSTDDIIPLQAMVDCSLDSGGLNMFVPTGKYFLSDTLKLHQGTSFMSFTFRGAGGIYNDAFGTAFDATAFGDRPAINVQGARSINLEDFSVFGKNVAPVTARATLDPTLANWITAGCQDTQFAPYAGVSIGAYTGAAPAGGYANDPYNRNDCSYVRLKNVTVSGFVVGLAVAPCNVSQDNDAITVTTSVLMNNTYGYSCGGSQSRSISFYNTDFFGSWAAVTTVRHGKQEGLCPNFYNGLFMLDWKLFELGSGSTGLISGVHAEAFAWLGEFGLGDSGGAEPTKFSGCHFTLYGSSYEPYFFIANKPIHFDACYWQDDFQRQVFNYFSTHPTKFDSCRFGGFIDTKNGFIGVIGFYYSIVNLFSGCEVHAIGSTDGNLLNINNEFIGVSYYAARQLIAPWTHTVRLLSNGYYSQPYKVKVPYTGEMSYMSVSGVSIAGTGLSAVLTFTATSADDFVVGDVLFWQVPDRSGTWTTLKIPAFKVTVNNAGAVTATALVDNVDVTYAPATINIAVPCFINATESVGDFGGAPDYNTIVNVTNIGNWKVGDWITDGGTNLYADTRIKAINGTTITLNKQSRDQHNGVALYNCRLTAM